MPRNTHHGHIIFFWHLSSRALPAVDSVNFLGYLDTNLSWNFVFLIKSLFSNNSNFLGITTCLLWEHWLLRHAWCKTRVWVDNGPQCEDMILLLLHWHMVWLMVRHDEMICKWWECINCCEKDLFHFVVIIHALIIYTHWLLYIYILS